MAMQLQEAIAAGHTDPGVLQVPCKSCRRHTVTLTPTAIPTLYYELCHSAILYLFLALI